MRAANGVFTSSQLLLTFLPQSHYTAYLTCSSRISQTTNSQSPLASPASSIRKATGTPYADTAMGASPASRSPSPASRSPSPGPRVYCIPVTAITANTSAYSSFQYIVQFDATITDRLTYDDLWLQIEEHGGPYLPQRWEYRGVQLGYWGPNGEWEYEHTANEDMGEMDLEEVGEVWVAVERTLELEDLEVSEVSEELDRLDVDSDGEN